MAKNKKQRWFSKGSWAGNEVDPNLFSNTIKKHIDKIKKVVTGVSDDEEDDSGYSSYNWELDRKLLDKPEEGDKKKTADFTKNSYNTAYKSYEKTGVWGGYYRVPQLTYKYVQQMANALSAQYGIRVQIGNDWKVDLVSKTLTYNPATLIYGTKAELLATLLHEIGKLRYVTHSSVLRNKYLTMYKQPAMEVLAIYEDVRTDYLMLQEYESAAEIYESVIPLIEKQVKGYMDYGEKFRELIYRITEETLRGIIQKYCDDSSSHIVNPNDPKLREQLFKVFGTTDLEKVKIGLAVVKANTENNGTIYEYCAEMLSAMYDLDDQHHRKFENIDEKMKLTMDSIEPSKKTLDSQALVDHLDIATYPHIEDLLKDAKDKNDQIQKAFPDMPQAVVKAIMENVNKQMGAGKGGVAVDAKGNMKTRTSGETTSRIPPEWTSGDYKVLKESVSMEIRQLVNRLTFLRREELTVRFQHDQKRGKLNSKKLYKSATGSRRLFKQKLENIDTIRSFAFSILLDVSGSMDGDRITHCTRALIILAEVFKKMQIPFEITVFDNNAKNIKPFTKDMDKKMEMSIGGLVRHSGGGTNLNTGLDALKIHNQPERNKIVIVLTDGGVSSPEYYDEKYFIPWRKQGIKAVGFGVECEDTMKKLCEGNTKMVDNVTELPVEFSNLLKSLIKR